MYKCIIVCASTNSMSELLLREVKNMEKYIGVNKGRNCCIGNDINFGKNVVIRHNCIIEDNVTLGDNVYIDSNTIIRSDVCLGEGTFIGSNCIIGEYQIDFCLDRKYRKHELVVGKNGLIRSGSIIYSGSMIGDSFQTGHQVTVREKSRIGNNVSIGTLSDIQGDCDIGNYVRMHSNVHIGQLSRIDDYVWIFPYVILTNDPTPPSEELLGVHVCSFAIVAANAVILPGIEIGEDSLVGAGAVVTRNVEKYAVVVGNPAQKVSEVQNIKNRLTGEAVYPWRNNYSKNMPWEKIGFEKWYDSLDIETKEKILF